MFDISKGSLMLQSSCRFKHLDLICYLSIECVSFAFYFFYISMCQNQAGYKMDTFFLFFGKSFPELIHGNKNDWQLI